jgi:hypothetical protein
VSINLADYCESERFLETTKGDPFPYVCGEGDARYISVGCNVLARAGYRVRHIQPDPDRPRHAIVLLERQ